MTKRNPDQPLGPPLLLFHSRPFLSRDLHRRTLLLAQFTMHFLRPRVQSSFIPAVRITKRTFRNSSRLREVAATQHQLAGKHCIITGASRGIGAEITRRFAEEGARCLLIGRNETLLEKVKEDLRKVKGGEHRVLVGDVGEEELWGLLKKEVGISPLSQMWFWGKSQSSEGCMGRFLTRS